MKRRNREISIFSMSALDLFASALGAFILIAIVMFPYFPNTGMASQAELDETLGELRAAVEGNDELTRIHDELNQAIGGLREELSRCQARADGLAADVEDARERIAELEGQLQDQGALQDELAACRNENQDQQRQIDDQERRLGDQQRQIDDQERQLGDQQRQIDDQERQLGDQQRQIETQQSRIDDLERRKFLLVTISWNGVRGDDVDMHVVDPNGNEYFYGDREHPGSDARFEEDSLHGPGNEVWLQPQVIPGEYRIYYNPFSLASDEVRVRGRVVHPATRHEFRERRLFDGGGRELVATVVVDGEGNVTVNE